MSVRFTLDGRTIEAGDGETIWQAAKRHGTLLPHLCHADAPGYRPSGCCRACVVEIEGERVLAASCARRPTAGMAVKSDSPRAIAARRMVFELLLADQPKRAHDPDSALMTWAEKLGITRSRFSPAAPPPEDDTHAAITVRLDSCIACGLCAQACRSVQGNDVIGLAHRGASIRVVFDFGASLAASSCVACGECVQVCPTGALLPRAFDRGTERVDSLCPYCGVGCQLTFLVRDGYLVGAEGRDGPSNHGRLCVKGRFGFDYVHHPHRLTTPLIRREDAPKRPDERIDPDTPFSHFRPASWREALDLVADRFKRIQLRQGPAALAGFGSAKGSNEEAYLFQKLIRTGFGTNNVDHCTRLCHASSVAALIEGIGSAAVSAPVEACLDAEVVLVIGANPTANHPVAASFMKNAAARGTRLIIADPRGGRGLARHAWRVLAFRPAADTALLSALVNVVIAEKLHKPDYIARHVEGFDDFARHIAPHTPEAMAPLCGVDPEALREVARAYAGAQSAMIFWGMGVSQHVHGTDNARLLIALALITGQIGRPGTGLHPLRGQNNVQGASDVGLIPMMLPGYRPIEDVVARHDFEQRWSTKLDPTRGLTVVEILDAARRGEIKGLYVMGENPAMSDPDLAHARAGLAALEFLTVQDIFLTETAMLADVILPATAFPEKTGTFTNTDRRIQLGRQAITPPGDARPDWWIIQEIARRLSLNWTYGGPAEIFAEFSAAIPALAGITWERLEGDGAATYPQGQDILFGENFPLPGGKARLVPVDPLPADEPPDHDYPLILTTGRLLEQWHTGAMTRRATTLERLSPGPVIFIHPETLAGIDGKEGDRLRLVSRRGAIEAPAWVDDTLPEDLVFMPFCYAEAAANRLTNPALDPFGKIPELKTCAVRIERRP